MKTTLTSARNATSHLYASTAYDSGGPNALNTLPTTFGTASTASSSTC